MKKLLFYILITVLTIFTLCSCGEKEFTIKVDGVIYKVDYTNQVIKDDNYSYYFTVSKFSSSLYIITITYHL